MSHERLTLAVNIALLLLIVGILVIVLLPGDALGSANGRIRSVSERESWLIHATLFATLAGTAGLRLVSPLPSLLTVRGLLVTVLLIAILATTTEFAQLQVSGRNATMADLLADLTGMTIGLAVAITIGPLIVARITRRRAF